MNFSKIFDHAPVGVLIYTERDQKILYANHSLLNHLKCVFDEIAGKHAKEILLTNEAGEKYLKNKGKIKLKVEIASGKLPINNSSDNFVIINYITLDAEKNDLPESVYLNAMMKGFPDLIYFKDKKSRFLKVNDTYLQKFDLDFEKDLKGKTDFDLFTEAHAKEAFADEQEIMKTEKPLFDIEEKEINIKNRKITWVSTSKMPFYDHEGNLIGTFGISKDITHQKKTELQVKDHLLVLQRLTSNIPIVIFKFYRESKKFDFLGNEDTIEAIKKSKVARLTIEDNLDFILDIVSGNKETKDFLTFSSSFHNDGISRYFDNYVFESVSGNVEYIGISIDATERKSSAQDIKRHAKSLEKVNRELGQFAYIISHDLKAPLRAITNLSEWIEEDLEGLANEEVKENLALLRARVMRMENLIKGILDYSRAARDTVLEKDIDVESLVSEVVDSLCIPKQYTINVSKKLPKISFNKSNLGRIFTNLISNAYKHHDKSLGNINISCTEKASAYEFCIEDDGAGIPEEYYEKVFVIFQTLQARDHFESTGIGLTIVKKIVEDCGGKIWIESELNKGTKFVFQIPKEMS